MIVGEADIIEDLTKSLATGDWPRRAWTHLSSIKPGIANLPNSSHSLQTWGSPCVMPPGFGDMWDAVLSFSHNVCIPSEHLVGVLYRVFRSTTASIAHPYTQITLANLAKSKQRIRESPASGMTRSLKGVADCKCGLVHPRWLTGLGIRCWVFSPTHCVKQAIWIRPPRAHRPDWNRVTNRSVALLCMPVCTLLWRSFRSGPYMITEHPDDLP